jgi:S-adenosylmethionine uptake transporter
LFSIPLANLSAYSAILAAYRDLWLRRFSLANPLGGVFVAIGIGFVGVTIIIRPGMDGFSVYSLLCVAAVIVCTFRDLASRRLSKTIPSSRVALSAALASRHGWHWIAGDARTVGHAAMGEWVLSGGASVC